MARVFKSFVSKFLFCCHKPKVYEEDGRTTTTLADLFKQDPIITDTTVVGEDDGGVEFFDAQDLEGYEATVQGTGQDHVFQEPNAKIGAFHGELVHGGDEKLDAQVGGGFTLDHVLHGGLLVHLQRDAAHVAQVLHGGDEDGDAEEEGCIAVDYVHDGVHGGEEDGDAEGQRICIAVDYVDGVTGEEEDGGVEKEGIFIAGDDPWEVVYVGEENGDLEGKGISIAAATIPEVVHAGEEEEDAAVEGISISAADVHEAVQGGGEDGDAEWNVICIATASVHEVVHGGEGDKEAIGISIAATASVQVVVHGREEEEDSEVEGAGDDDHNGGVEDMDAKIEGIFIVGDDAHEEFYGGKKDGEVDGISIAAVTIPEVVHAGEEEEDAAVEGISISAADIHEAVQGGGEDGDAEWNVICIATAGVHEVVYGGEGDKEAIGISIAAAAASVQLVVHGREEEEDSKVEGAGDDDHNGGVEDMDAKIEGIFIVGDDAHEEFYGGEKDGEVDGISIAAVTIPEVVHAGEEEEDAAVEGISISAADVHEAVQGGGEDGDAEWNVICIATAGVHEVVHGGEGDKEAIGISIAAAASVQVVVHGREEEEDSKVEGAGDDDHNGGVEDMDAKIEGIFIVGDDAHEEFYGGEKDGEVEGKGFCMSGYGHEVFNGENEGDVESEGAYKALVGGNQLVDQVDADGVVRVFHKREDFEVFVGGLDKRTSESDLRKVFCTVGQVVEVRLVMNSMTYESKGFAFLQFAAVEQAKRAVLELNNTFVNGRRCGVTANRGRGRFAPTNSRRDRGAFYGGRVPKSLPPHPPSPNPTFAGRGRGGFRGRVAPRNIQGDRQPLRSLYDGARGLPPPESFYDRRPSVSSYPKSAQGSCNVRHGLSYNGSRIGSGGGRCSESFGRGYLSRGSDVDGSSYSSYTGRGYCGKGYYGSSSYY